MSDDEKREEPQFLPGQFQGNPNHHFRDQKTNKQKKKIQVGYKVKKNTGYNASQHSKKKDFQKILKTSVKLKEEMQEDHC